MESKGNATGGLEHPLGRPQVSTGLRGGRWRVGTVSVGVRGAPAPGGVGEGEQSLREEEAKYFWRLPCGRPLALAITKVTSDGRPDSRNLCPSPDGSLEF